MSNQELACICCMECRKISYNPNDVLERYCGNCSRYLRKGEGLIWAVDRWCGECGPRSSTGLMSLRVDSEDVVPMSVASYRCGHVTIRGLVDASIPG